MTSTRVKRKHQRRHRGLKLHALRRKLAETHSLGERLRLIEKMKRISPRAFIPEG